MAIDTHTTAESKPAPYPEEYNPFDGVEFLPGLGRAVLWVVLAYAFVNLLLLPVHPL